VAICIYTLLQLPENFKVNDLLVYIMDSYMHATAQAFDVADGCIIGYAETEAATVPLLQFGLSALSVDLRNTDHSTKRLRSRPGCTGIAPV